MRDLEELLKNLVPHQTAEHAARHAGRLMHPVRDWYILLLLLLVSAVVAIGLGVSLYLGAVRSGEGTAEVAATPRASTLDRSTLRETVLYFEGQAKEFEMLRVRPPKVPMPK